MIVIKLVDLDEQAVGHRIIWIGGQNVVGKIARTVLHRSGYSIDAEFYNMILSGSFDLPFRLLLAANFEISV
ncbi:MAG: hypothetical protein ACPGLY_07480 [Rubripirellula sp.]